MARNMLLDFLRKDAGGRVATDFIDFMDDEIWLRVPQRADVFGSSFFVGGGSMAWGPWR